MAELGNGVVWSDDWDKLGAPTKVFSPYTPKYVDFGVAHSNKLVEGTILASVDPPKITYELQMPRTIYNAGEGNYPLISSAQLEAIIYACQSFQETFRDDNDQEVTYGFYLGDGKGVGKTRTLAGINYECMNADVLGPISKTVWVTTKKPRFAEIRAQIKHIGGDIKVLSMEDIRNPAGIQTQAQGWVLLVTYGQLSNDEDRKRLESWMQQDFSGCLFFDDASYPMRSKEPKAQLKGAKPMVHLQTKYPEAKVVYAAATGALEVLKLLAFRRLGLWGKHTPYTAKTFERLKFKGDGALELLAMDLKVRGLFLSRHLNNGLDMPKIQALREIDLKDFKSERIFSDPIEIEGVTSVLHCFKLDRTAQDEFAQHIKEADVNWTFYEKGTGSAVEIVMARRTRDDLWEVMYPFCKDLKQLAANSLVGWNPVSTYEGYKKWRLQCYRIDHYPKYCADQRRSLFDRCGRIVPGIAMCTHQWGITNFYVITRPTLWVLEKLDSPTLRFEVIRVIIPNQDSFQTEEVGLFVANQNCIYPKLPECLKIRLGFEQTD